jgi:hypothetical protein
MKGSRPLLCALVGLFLAVFLLAGCDGGGNILTSAGDATPGTVNLLLIDSQSRAVVPSDLSLTLTQIALLTDGAIVKDPWAAIPDAWAIPSGLINPDLPIPVINKPTLVELLHGDLPADYTQTATAQVPPGLYTQLRLVLDPVSAHLIDTKLLPFDKETLTAFIPIMEGMKVDPQGTVTLLVDIYQQKAQAINGDFRL